MAGSASCVGACGDSGLGAVSVAGHASCDRPLDANSPETAADAQCVGGGDLLSQATGCPAPSVGVPPDCHTVALCDPGVGVQVDGAGNCRPEPEPCDGPSVGLQPGCHAATPCATGYGLQVDGSPTCIGTLGFPTGARSCSQYNAFYGPTPPYPGQDSGIVVEFDPPGPAGDVAFCAGTATGAPCGPGQPGAVVDNAPACVPTPPAPCASPSIGVAPDCHTVSFCAPDSAGVQVDNTQVCKPLPIPCPSPSVGIQNYGGCYTVEACDPPTTVGVTVNGEGECVLVPVPCEVPTIGVEPDCHTVETCDPPTTVGATVDGEGECVLVPVPCAVPTIGVEPDCHTVTPCPGAIGVQVDGTPVCTPTPVPCDVPSVGIENYGGCHTAEACDPPTTVGATVDGEGACVPTPVPCSSAPAPGWAVGADGTCVGLPWAVPGAAPCAGGATVDVRVYWGTTPGFTPGSTFDACF